MKLSIDVTSKKPRLAYQGMDKKTLVEAVPSQVIEIVYPAKAQEQTKELLPNASQEALWGERQMGLPVIVSQKVSPKNRLIWTNDNLVALKTLLDEKDSISGEYKYRGKIDLIYIDPPFMIQDDFVAQNSIDIDVDEEEGVVSVKEPTIIETIAYKDTWKNGLDSFLQMMRERLELMKDLLSNTGSIYLHLDWHTVHYVKVLMDEIFDYGNMINDIVWKRKLGTAGQSKQYGASYDQILFYSKTNEYNFNPQKSLDSDHVKEYIKSRFTRIDKTGKHAGKKWMPYPLANPGEPTKGLIYKYKGYLPPPKGWRMVQEKLKALDDDGRIYYPEKGGERLQEKKFLDEYDGQPISNLWTDLHVINSQAYETTGYPTQKPVELLKRIITTSCPKNGTVLDAFMGSGTTCEAAELLADELNCTWIGIDNSKFAIHTARKRLIELNGKKKEKKGEGIYKVRPFTVENMGYYQRGVKWDPIQVGKHADAYRQAIIELFGGEYIPYSPLLHGKKKGAWVHIGPLSTPIVSEQIQAIAKEVKDTEFKKCYVLSADFTAHLNQAVVEAKKEFGVQIMVRIIPASAIDEVKKRLELIKQGVKNTGKVSDMPNIVFFAPLTVKINKVVDDKEIMIELAGLEVDADSFLDGQKPERRKELEKWLEKENSWQSFVDFWAIDWNYENLKGNFKEPIFENEWQSFKKRKGKKITEDLVFKAFHPYEQAGEYTVAIKVTDVFGNDGIITTKVVIK